MRRLWSTLLVVLAITVELRSACGQVVLDHVGKDAFVETGTSYALHTEHEESCDDFGRCWSFNDLKHDLETRVHGQHIAIPTVLESVGRHLNDPNPQKPLVLSFHGWTGTGKNFVTKIIVENVYNEKEKSACVHSFVPYVHFSSPKKIDLHKGQIMESVTKCERSTFIFDEMIAMPEGMIDVLIPFFGDDAFVDGVNFRKSIFIFLSYTGANAMMNVVLQRRQNGQKRESSTLADLEAILKHSVSTQPSGLRGSKLIEKNLIDHFIPFLPLERKHVRSCIRDEFERQGVLSHRESDVEKVLDELKWFPTELNLYSTSGCKMVAKKVSNLL